MKNIHKIAEEIFKTPSQIELMERTKLSKHELADWFMKLKVTHEIDNELLKKILDLFPDGAYQVDKWQQKEIWKLVLIKTNDAHWTRFGEVIEHIGNNEVKHIVWYTKIDNINVIAFDTRTQLYLLNELPYQWFTV